MINELTLYRTLHSLLAVARLVSELRQAINLMAESGDGLGTPYTIDDFESSAVDCFAALAEALRALEHTSVPVQRARKRGQLGPTGLQVSRETWPWDDDTDVTEVPDGRS